MLQEKLVDTVYKKNGSSILDLFASLGELSSSTRVVVVKNPRFYKHLSDGVGPGLAEVPPIFGVLRSGEFIPEEVLRDASTGELRNLIPDLWDEAKASSLFIQYEENGVSKILSTSPAIIKDLPLFKISGEANRVMSYYTIGKMAEMANDTMLSLIVRTADDGTEKIFSIRSAGYMLVSQHDIFTIAEDLLSVEAGGTLLEWEISHFNTEAVYRFGNDSAVITTRTGKRVEMVPHITVSTSDTGDASIRFSLAWRGLVGTRFLAGGKDSASRKHSGVWNTKAQNALKNDVKHLLGKLTTLPQKIQDLDGITVKRCDLDAVVENLLIDSKIKGNPILNRDVYNAVKKYTVDNLSAISGITGADIVLTMMEAQERLPVWKLSNEQQRIFERCMAELPYCRIRGAITV